MNDSHDLHATDELRRALRLALPVEDSDRVSQRRNRLVSVIEREILDVPARTLRQERRNRALRLGFAAAALLLAGLGTSRLITNAGPTSPQGAADSGAAATGQAVSTEHALLSLREGHGGTAEPKAMERGSSVELVGGQHADLVLPGGTHMSLDQKGQLLLVESSEYRQTVKLSSGRLEVDVKKGEARRRRVSVLTAQARVEVTGTRFVVSVQPGNEGVAESTSVEVLRGEVLVSHEAGSVRLHPGESWSSQVLSAMHDVSGEPEGRAEAPTSSAAAVRGTSGTGQLRQMNQSSNGHAESTLPRQNSLIEHALRLERNGHAKQAESVLLDLLRSYPHSPLRSTVQAELKRLRSDG